MVFSPEKTTTPAVLFLRKPFHAPGALKYLPVFPFCHTEYYSDKHLRVKIKLFHCTIKSILK